MSIGIENFLPQINPVTADYPYGDIKDDNGSGNGTNVDRRNHADYHQTFRRLLALASIVPNNLVDNVTNGYQYVDAITRLKSMFKDVLIKTFNTTLTKADMGKLIILNPTSVTTITMPSLSALINGEKISFINYSNYRIDIVNDPADISSVHSLFSYEDSCTLTYSSTLPVTLLAQKSISFVAPVWTGFTPTVVAYDAGGSVVTNGVTGTINGFYKRIDSNFYLILSSSNFSTLTNVRSFTITNIATLLNLISPQLAIGGGSFAISPLSCKSNIYYLYNGSGDSFTISKNDNTDFGVTTNLTFRYSTLIAITG